MSQFVRDCDIAIQSDLGRNTSDEEIELESILASIFARRLVSCRATICVYSLIIITLLLLLLSI